MRTTPSPVLRPQREPLLPEAGLMPAVPDVPVAPPDPEVPELPEVPVATVPPLAAICTVNGWLGESPASSPW